MANTLKSIVGKLNDTMRGTLEGAAGLCLARTHYDVEIEHFLMKLLDASGTDFAGIIQTFRSRQGAAGRRTGAQPGQTEDRQRAHAGVQPVAAADAARSLDHRLAGIRRGQVRSGRRDPGAGVRRRAIAHRARCQQGIPKIEAEALRKVLPAILADSREYTADADEAPARVRRRRSGAAKPRAARRRTWISSRST